jgi:hypothetical protein
MFSQPRDEKVSRVSQPWRSRGAPRGRVHSSLGNCGRAAGMRRHQRGSGRREIARSRRCLRPVQVGRDWPAPRQLRCCCPERQRAFQLVSSAPWHCPAARLKARSASRRRPPLLWLLSAFIIASMAGPPSGAIVPLPVEVTLAPGWAAHELTFETTDALLGVVSERITLDLPLRCRGATPYQAAPCIPLFVQPNVFHPPIIVDAVDLRHDADHVRLPAGSATIMHDDRPRAVLL